MELICIQVLITYFTSQQSGKYAKEPATQIRKKRRREYLSFFCFLYWSLLYPIRLGNIMEIYIDATFTKPGKKYMICSCGYKKEEEVIPKRNTPIQWKTVGKEPKETEEGYYVNISQACNEVVCKREEIPMLSLEDVFNPSDIRNSDSAGGDVAT